ncbi:type VI secretion system baseplate subunit TssE [Serratia fonticola]|uniref:type VI secretion system baseplate subunit TssE n=1 Tax=Serratia fonticola TaxID=47917 RepID=UPI0003FEAC09|nr:type VI secretion system baseplate subunit TssE [Serratia fonticola]
MQLQPSFLHRLHDDFPREEQRVIKNCYRRQEILNSLVKDLNMLFSSRPLSAGSELYGELERSILNYGVLDVVDVDIMDDELINRLRNNIHQTLTYFEPRLRDISIKLQNNSPENIRFWVQGIVWGECIVFSVSWSNIAYTYSISWEK